MDFLKNLPTYEIQIGVISANTNRKQTVQVGLTNAELMFIHERGSPLRNLPARPVLQMTIDYANQHLLNNAIDKAINAYINSGFDLAAFELELKKLCMRMQRYARELIYSNDGRLAPNALSTERAKGFNHPLFKTGQLVKSITCELLKEGKVI